MNHRMPPLTQLALAVVYLPHVAVAQTHETVNQFRVAKLTLAADLIVIGTSCEPVMRILDRGRKGPPFIVGFSIPIIEILKGRVEQADVRPDKLSAIRKDALFINWKMRRQKLSIPDSETCDSGEQFIYFMRIQGAGSPGVPHFQPVDSQSWFISANDVHRKVVGEAHQLPTFKDIRAVDGLQFVIRSRETELSIGEPIWIDFFFRNASDDVILLPQQRARQEDSYPFTSFSGTRFEQRGNEVSKYVHITKPHPYPLDKNRDLLPLITLRPGQVYQENVRLDSWQWESHTSLPFGPDGSLLLEAEFDTFRFSEVYPEFAKSCDKSLWIGRCRSRQIRIRFTNKSEGR